MDKLEIEQLVSHAISEYFSQKKIRDISDPLPHLVERIGFLDGNIKKLNINVENYSKSSAKHANAIKWLTAGLVIVGLFQFLSTAYLSYGEYTQYKNVSKTPKQTIIKQAQ